MPPKKKVATGYKFAEPLPKGTVLTDGAKQSWKLGASIGKGGFGDIYEARKDGTRGASYPYIVKIEPHANGPLFVEINFYIRHGKPADVEAYKKAKKLQTLGIPLYYGSGSHDFKGEKYRFLVTDKFSRDLHTVFQEHQAFHSGTVFNIAIQLLDALEYIHSTGYVHADIKGANILLGIPEGKLDKQVYLMDFGLVTKFTTQSTFKPNPKKAHDGTIEFLSRDAHQGVPTRRGDLENLAYVLIQWLGGTLPWEDNLSDPKTVQKSKEKHMSSAKEMVKACFGSKPHPKAISTYITYVLSMDFDTPPDYKKVRSIFESGLKEARERVGAPLTFHTSLTPT
ncbi:hypothetical protein HUJ04_004450 [Dendroctonus ponderosae]